MESARRGAVGGKARRTVSQCTAWRCALQLLPCASCAPAVRAVSFCRALCCALPAPHCACALCCCDWDATSNPPRTSHAHRTQHATGSDPGIRTVWGRGSARSQRLAAARLGCSLVLRDFSAALRSLTEPTRPVLSRTVPLNRLRAFARVLRRPTPAPPDGTSARPSVPVANAAA